MPYYVIDIIESYEDWMTNYSPPEPVGGEQSIENAWDKIEDTLEFYYHNHLAHLDRETEEYFGDLENIPEFEDSHWCIYFRLVTYSSDSSILEDTDFLCITYDYISRNVEMEFCEAGCSDLDAVVSKFLRSKCNEFKRKFAAAEINFFENESEENRSRRFC